MANSTIPLCSLRGANLYKRRYRDTISDEDIAEGEVTPLITFLKEVSKLHLLWEKQVSVNCMSLHVASDTLLISQFNRKEHELKLYDIAKDREMCVINTKEDYFDTDTIVIIGSWGLNLLAYTIPLMDDGEAALVKIDINTMSTSKLQSWDLSVFWTHRSLIYHKEAGPISNSIKFDSTATQDGKLIILTGPSETFGSSNVCKVINAETTEVIQVIGLNNYKCTHATAFHPDNNQIAMICSSAIDSYVSDPKNSNMETYSKNHVICYSLSTKEMIAKSTFSDVVPQLLRISPNGELIGIKRASKGAVAILCSRTLHCFLLVEQEFNFSANSELLTNLLFQTFPLFSRDSRQCVVLQKKRKICGDRRMKTFRWSNGDLLVTRLSVPNVIGESRLTEEDGHHRDRKKSHGKYCSQNNDFKEGNHMHHPVLQFGNATDNKRGLSGQHSLVQLDNLSIF